MIERTQLSKGLACAPYRPCFRSLIRGTQVSFCAFLFVLTAEAGIDLRPQAGEKEVDGVVFKQLIFQENGKKIAYQYPPGWNYTNAANGLRLSPPDHSLAQGEIAQTPLPLPLPAGEAAVKELQAQAIRTIPAGSEEMTLVAEEQNPVRFLGHDSYGVTINYLLHGQAFTCNVLFANLDDSQVRFRFVARKDEFEKVFRSFRGSLFTFQRL